MPDPLVSIVIPTFNCEGFLEDCLQSVKKQTWSNIEIIIVDGFSSDRTPEIAKKYGKVYFYGRDPSQKLIFAVPYQRNYGAKMGVGKYTMYFDSDMRMPERVIERCMELTEKENADAVIMPEVCYGEGFWAKCRALEKTCYNISAISQTDAARFIKKTVWDALEGLDATLGGGDDYDFQLRLNEGGYKTVKSDQHLLHYDGRLTLRKQIRKKFVYGKHALVNYRKHRKRKTYLVKQYSLIRPDFIKNYKLLLRNPFHALGMIILKSVEYAAGLCGMIHSMIFKEEVILKG